MIKWVQCMFSDLELGNVFTFDDPERLMAQPLPAVTVYVRASGVVDKGFQDSLVWKRTIA